MTPPKLLIEIKEEVCIPLTVIFQKSLAAGQARLHEVAGDR